MEGDATSGALSGIGSGSPNLLLYSGDGGTTPPPPPPPPPADTEVHVGNIEVSASYGKRNANGTALVTVVDAAGAPVGSATVVGNWMVNGSTMKTGTSGVSGGDGVASIGSGGLRRVNSSDEIEFCVTNITGTGLTYDSSANVERCDTVGDGGGEPPPPSGLSLSASVRRSSEVRLSWSGGTPDYTVYFQGGAIATVGGTRYDHVPGSAGTWDYRVCDTDGACADVTVTTKR
jgi:hypothetical protein